MKEDQKPEKIVTGKKLDLLDSDEINERESLILLEKNIQKNYIFNEKKVQIMLFIKYNVIILLKITQTINPRV